MAMTTSTLTKVEFVVLQTSSPNICGSVAHSYQIGVSQQHVSGSTPAGRIPMIQSAKGSDRYLRWVPRKPAIWFSYHLVCRDLV